MNVPIDTQRVAITSSSNLIGSRSNINIFVQNTTETNRTPAGYAASSLLEGEFLNC
jgi:hypothetical protein